MMADTTPDERALYEEVSQRIHRRFKRRMEIIEGLIAFVVANAIFWVLWAFTAPEARVGVWLPLLLTGVSGAALFSSFLKIAFEEMEARVIEREMAQEREWRLQMVDKIKNDDRSLTHLSDDGELIEDFVQDEVDYRKMKRE